MVKQFIKDYKEDRKAIWEFLEPINQKVTRIEANLELLLKGARLRWNNAPWENKKQGE